jgi:hypothetical protein
MNLKIMLFICCLPLMAATQRDLVPAIEGSAITQAEASAGIMKDLEGVWKGTSGCTGHFETFLQISFEKKSGDFYRRCDNEPLVDPVDRLLALMKEPSTELTQITGEIPSFQYFGKTYSGYRILEFTLTPAPNDRFGDGKPVLSWYLFKISLDESGKQMLTMIHLYPWQIGPKMFFEIDPMKDATATYTR